MSEKITYQNHGTFEGRTRARAEAAERVIQASLENARQGILPQQADDDAPRPERPQQSADHGDVRGLAYSVAEHPAYFQMFTTRLTAPSTVRLGVEGARCGKVAGELHLGDEVVFVYSAPRPAPTFSHPQTRVEINLDRFGVCRETTLTLPGDPDPAEPEYPLTFTARGRNGSEVPMATLGNGEWIKLRFAWNAWSVVAQGRVEASA